MPGLEAPDGGLALDGSVFDAGSESSNTVMVGRVVDGDTIALSAPGDLRAPDQQPLDGDRVRFIGVDTPEVSHDGTPSDCFGDEARTFTRGRLEGRFVRLDYDFSGGLRDRFGRLLAYVVVDDEVVNEALVRGGYARVYREFTYREKSNYLALESEAQARRLGLWGACP